MLNVILLLLLFSTVLLGQNTEQKATNTKEAVKNYEQFNERLDTMQTKQDSMMEVWEKRIEQMKTDQKKREGSKTKKPE